MVHVRESRIAPQVCSVNTDMLHHNHLPNRHPKPRKHLRDIQYFCKIPNLDSELDVQMPQKVDFCKKGGGGKRQVKMTRTRSWEELELHSQSESECESRKQKVRVSKVKRDFLPRL